MNIRGTWTLFAKENRRFLEVWSQTLLAPVVTNVLFMVVFGVALSDRASSFEGYEYLQVLLPGLVAMAIMMNAFQNPSSSLMIAKYTDAISDLLRIPLRGYELVIAYIAAGFIRGILVGIVTLLVGLFFVQIPIASIPIILAFSVLIAATFSSLGVIVGIMATNFDQSGIIQNFLLTPLIYLGGVFFSISALPTGLQSVAKVNPLLYLIDGFRFGFLGAGDVPVAHSFIFASILFLIVFTIASWMFSTGYRLRT